jgi:hypothetical protein
LSEPTASLLSVVVTIIEGGEALEECLRALEAQSPPLEIIVPYDTSVPDMAAVEEAHPDLRFLPMGEVQTEHPRSGPAGQHELFDRRRAAGLAAARCELIAILEDRGVPRLDWAEQMIELHRAPHAAIGGAVECGIDQPLNWAVYFCDFSRYQLPFEEGVQDYITDVNICYKRSALEATREVWQERYHETNVNWSLLEAGHTLYLAPEPVVDQVRRKRGIGALLSERYHWGRLFAHTRVNQSTPLRRAVYLLMAPLLPFLLLLRHANTQRKKAVRWRRFVQVAPLVFVLLVAWSLGEFVGYATGRA